jgi:hypothetical protein
VGIQPHNAPAPMPRKWWVAKQSNQDRRSSLLVEHLEALATRRSGDESASIWAFLIAWRKASVCAELTGATLIVRRNLKQLNQAIVFVMVPGVGPVTNVLVLIAPWSDHFTQFMRVCGECRCTSSIALSHRTDACG